MPMLLVVFLESIGKWFDEPSSTTFTPVYDLPLEVSKFQVNSKFEGEVFYM